MLVAVMPILATAVSGVFGKLSSGLDGMCIVTNISGPQKAAR